MTHFFLIVLCCFVGCAAKVEAAARPVVPKRPMAYYKDRDKRAIPGPVHGSERFSGALRWAHARGITGAGVTVAVVDLGKISKQNPFLKKEMGELLVEAPTIQILDEVHGANVVYVLHTVAPDAQVVYAELQEEKRLDLYTLLIKAPILNCCFYVYSDVIRSRALMNLMRDGTPKLLVSATPNFIDDDEDLTSGVVGTWRASNYVAEFGGRMILVGRCDARYNMTSPVPGRDRAIQDCFVVALGDDVYINSSGDLRSGTSFATPTVSGLAALILQVCPGLSPEEVREIILRSASRDFFVFPKDPANRSIIHYRDVFISEWSKKRTFLLKGVTYTVEEKYFPSEVYGRGILNARRALALAQLKKENPGYDLDTLLFRVREEEQAEDDRQAANVQKVWRGRQVRKRLREEKKLRRGPDVALHPHAATAAASAVVQIPPPLQLAIERPASKPVPSPKSAVLLKKKGSTPESVPPQPVVPTPVSVKDRRDFFEQLGRK